MADNNRISIKKTSRVLAITCVAYTTVATILYNNYQIDQIDLIDYSTPVILGTVVLSIDDLETLHENIESLAYGQAELYKPIRSKPDNQIKSPSLRHYAWNIGERLDIPLIDRAKFIKTIFPHELENATIEYLCKNLRDSVPAIIAIDVPKNGDYHFSCMQTSADSDN